MTRPLNLHQTDIIKEKVLSGELNKWLDQVSETVEPYPIKGGKAIIAPSVVRCSTPTMHSTEILAKDMQGTRTPVQRLHGLTRALIPRSCLSPFLQSS